VTSPITHMFSSAAKGVLQALLGVWIFEDLFTTTRAASTVIIIVGTILYTWVKACLDPLSRTEPTSLPMRSRSDEAQPFILEEIEERDEEREEA